jgi:hypothetical protein
MASGGIEPPSFSRYFLIQVQLENDLHWSTSTLCTLNAKVSYSKIQRCGRINFRTGSIISDAVQKRHRSRYLVESAVSQLESRQRVCQTYGWESVAQKKKTRRQFCTSRRGDSNPIFLAYDNFSETHLENDLAMVHDDATFCKRE